MGGPGGRGGEYRYRQWGVRSEAPGVSASVCGAAGGRLRVSAEQQGGGEQREELQVCTATALL